MEARLPFPQGCLTPGSVPGPLWSPPSRIEWVTEGYSLRIASHSLVLEPRVMHLLCFAGKGAERRGQVGALFSNSGTCVWWESVTTSRPANTHLTPCSQDSGLSPGQMPQRPDTEVKGTQAAALTPDLHKSTPPPQEPRGHQGASAPGLGSSGDSRPWVSPLQKGHREEQWEAGVFLQGKSEHSHPSRLLTLILRQKSRKQRGGKATWGSPGDTCLHEGAQAPLPQCFQYRPAGSPEP